MKKSLIALAVLAASGAAMAQSSVTMYGVADVWVGSVKVDGERTTKMVSGGVSTSAWGIKGSEDLGGGLKANFLLEQGITLDDGKTTGSGFDRQAYVGFSGGFGEVKLGNVWTAYDDISGATNPVFDSDLSPVVGVWESTGYNSNPGNNIYYATPSMGGFSGAVSYSVDEEVAGQSEITSLHVKYTGGPLYVGLGYQTQEVYGSNEADDFLRLNGSYDFGVAKLLLGYGQVDYAAAATSDVDEWTVGVDVPLSANLTLSGGYAKSTPDFGNDSEGYGIAAAYSLSKRTTLYGGYHNRSTDNTSANDVDVFAVGVKHTF